MTSNDPARLAEDGKRAFQNRQFDQAAGLFHRAAEAYTSGGDGPAAAEMQNNRSVALLQAGKAEESLQAALGTDRVFAGASDLRRQGMALGNQAAALEALKRTDEALAAYDRAADVLKQAGEGELLSMVKKAAAAIRLQRGQVGDSALNMIGSLEAREKPTIFERILRSILRLKLW